MILDNLPPEVAQDLIILVNGLGTIPKTASVNYKAVRFRYVPLDDVLAKIKADGNFALMQPLTTLPDGQPALQCILVHKGGYTITSDPYPLHLPKSNPDAPKTKQDEGADITYTRRYSVACFLSIASDEDTDANNAGKQLGVDIEMMRNQVEQFARDTGKDLAKVLTEMERLFGPLEQYDTDKAKRARAQLKTWQQAINKKG
jgi:hypothetical protein